MPSCVSCGMRLISLRCVEVLGDAVDLLPTGIAFTCRKGNLAGFQTLKFKLHCL